MGVEKGMDNKCTQVVLYTIQTSDVLKKLKENGYHVAKMNFIKEKYGDVAPVFVDAYKWYACNAEKIVPRPDEAESGVWSFRDPSYIEKHSGSHVLQIEAPIDKAVFFRMSDWNKRLNLRYIGKSSQEEDSYNQNLSRYGIGYEGDVYLTSFYPQLKNQLVKSWENLFMYDSQIKETGDLLFQDMQAGFWKLEWDWVKKIF